MLSISFNQLNISKFIKFEIFDIVKSYLKNISVLYRIIKIKFINYSVFK